jgi:hypothetical protein
MSAFGAGMFVKQPIMSTPGESFEQHRLPSRRFAGVLALAGCTLTILTFYPGFLSPDSVDQFEQSLNFHFVDWHPPIMAFVWSVLDALWAGPQPMLILQAILYWGGVFYLISTIKTERHLVRWIIAALLFSPAILNFVGVIWKDVQLAAAWSFVMGCVFAYRCSGLTIGVYTKAKLLALVVYGALIRWNAGLAAAPLVLYVLTGRPWMRHLPLTAVVYLGVALSALGLQRGVNRLLGAETTPIFDSLLSFDIAGISVQTKENLYPFALSTPEMESLSACYGDASAHDSLVGGPCEFIWSNVAKVRQTDKFTMLRAWLSATIRNPAAYMRHRLKYFGFLLAVTTPDPSKYIWQSGIEQNHFGLETRRHGLYHLLARYVHTFSSTFLFRPVTWLTISLLLMGFVAKFRPDDEKSRFVMTASLLAASYMLAYLPVGIASDFRYIYVCIIATTFALCVVVGEPWGFFQQKK